MAIPEHAQSIEQVVPFQHCDPLGVVWHGRYFEYFEQARTALMRSIDLDVEVIRGMGYKLFVVDARCRYMRPLMYGDTLRCTGWFLKPDPHVRIAFNVYNVTQDAKSARAVLTFATTRFDGELLPEVPAAFIERLPDGR